MVMLKGVHEAQASSRDWGIPGHARRPGYRHRGGQGRLARAHETGQPGRRRHAVMGVFLLRAPIGVGSEALAGRPRMEEFAGPHLSRWEWADPALPWIRPHDLEVNSMGDGSAHFS